MRYFRIKLLIALDGWRVTELEGCIVDRHILNIKFTTLFWGLKVESTEQFIKFYLKVEMNLMNEMRKMS